MKASIRILLLAIEIKATKNQKTDLLASNTCVQCCAVLVSRDAVSRLNNSREMRALSNAR